MPVDALVLLSTTRYSPACCHPAACVRIPSRHLQHEDAKQGYGSGSGGDKTHAVELARLRIFVSTMPEPPLVAAAPMADFLPQRFTPANQDMLRRCAMRCCPCQDDAGRPSLLFTRTHAAPLTQACASVREARDAFARHAETIKNEITRPGSTDPFADDVISRHDDESAVLQLHSNQRAVGRNFLACLRACFAVAGDGSLSTLSLCIGPAGAGKSRVIHALLAHGTFHRHKKSAVSHMWRKL
eukprot:COSAG01_NODE_10265_length_2206_cov_1.252966_3_plen_242_part_00